MLSADGAPRAHWRHVAGALARLGDAELRRRDREAAQLLARDGAVYNAYGASRRPGQPWRLDPVPTVLDAGEWQAIEAGVIERAELLSHVLEDLYGPRELLRRGLLPPEVVFDHEGFLRACDGVRLPGAQQLLTYAADLGRDRDGRWTVLTDRAQAPSGVGYALENRTVASRVLPTLLRDAGVHRLEPFLRALRAALRGIAPRGVDDPRIVVLTPGPWNETAFEHAVLATRLGFPLVQGSDLVVRGGALRMRALGRSEPVHVVLRRVDGSYCDPLELRPESELGVAGLVEVTRRGTATVANTLGSSVIENPALMRFLPGIAEHVLGRPPRLPSVPAWWCGDPEERAHVLERLDRLVLRPLSREAGASSSFGAQLSDAELADLRARIERHPTRWVAHAPLRLSTTPALTTEGLAPRRSVLRTFAVAREGSYVVMPGGLTRVAPDDGRAPISNQAGAIAKDTWVLASEPERMTAVALTSGPSVTGLDPAAVLSPRVAENLWWIGRYAERAQGVARLLRVVHDRRNDVADAVDDAGGAALDALFGAVARATGSEPAVEDRWAELLALLVDDRRPGTVAFAVRLLLEDAHAVRDQLSDDTWLAVGDLDRRLAALRERGPAAAGPEVQATLQRVLRALLALNGIVDDGMVRDVGWRFLDAGRRIERSLALATLARGTLPAVQPTVAGSLVLESVLVASESIITYRRRYRAHAQLATALELLLHDEANPRSMIHQLRELEADLAAFPRIAPGRLRADEREVAEAVTALRVADVERLVADPEGGRPGLVAFLDDQLARLTRAAEAVEREHLLDRLPHRRVRG